MKLDAQHPAIKSARPRWSRYALAQEIRDFLEEFDLKPTPFGLAAAKDDKLLWRIENAPNGISLDKADRIRAFMSEFRAKRHRELAIHDTHPRDRE